MEEPPHEATAGRNGSPLRMPFTEDGLIKSSPGTAIDDRMKGGEYGLNSTKFWMQKYRELKWQNDLLREQRDMLARQKEELEEKFAHIKRFEGIIPLCMHCKSIRNEDGVWQILEHYLTEHSDAAFSHGICPGCMEKHYPMIGNEDGLNSSLKSSP